VVEIVQYHFILIFTFLLLFFLFSDFALAGSIIIILLLLVAATEVDKSKLPISEAFYLFNIITKGDYSLKRPYRKIKEEEIGFCICVLSVSSSNELILKRHHA
jgi:hypothetical protein